MNSSMRAIWSRISWRAFGAIVCIIFLLSAIAYLGKPILVKNFEKVVFWANPSADLAFAYGEKYFYASHNREYDVELAKFYFDRALKMDSTLPLVRHELGRIAFLYADFPIALNYLNQEIDLGPTPTPTPASYYVRALIKGYMGDYKGAAADYEKYFAVTSANWGSINDYSWVLLKAGLPEQALYATQWGLDQWPNNPWLLSSEAIALFELHRYQEAKISVDAALEKIDTLTPEDWLTAYPGNDPRVAEVGLKTFKDAALTNKRKIEDMLTRSK